MKALAVAAALFAGAQTAEAAIDVDALWDYADPAMSAERFRAALAEAKGDDVLILRTQIARTFSLRNRFDEAHRELDVVDPLLPAAHGAEPRVRALLERGRTLRSANLPAQARPYFLRAFDVADHAKLESLAADALHMVALSEAEPAGQLEWNRRTLDYARAAKDPKARRWEAVALNNLGDSLREAGRHAEALSAFREALTAYESRGKPASIRFARWQVANTLRLLGRVDEALTMQLALEAEGRAAGQPDPDVYEELALLHDARGDLAAAAKAREQQKAAAK